MLNFKKLGVLNKDKWRSIKHRFVNYLHGDKEIWEYDIIAIKLTLLVRVFYFFIYFLIGFLPVIMIVLVLFGVKIEYLGVLFGAIAAGIFTTITSLSNTESNLRNIRCSWIDESRKDFMNYMSMGRKFLSACHTCRGREIKYNTSKNSDNENIVKNLVEKLEHARQERSAATKEFYELYVKISLRFRGKKKGSEEEVYKNLKAHYKKYRELSISINKAGQEEYKAGEFGIEYKNEDKTLIELFGKYLNEEWKRAKKGDVDILNKKKALFAILVILAISFSIYFIGIDLFKKDESPEENALNIVAGEFCDNKKYDLICI